MNVRQNTIKFDWMHGFWHQHKDTLHFNICIHCCFFAAVCDPIGSDLWPTALLFSSSILTCHHSGWIFACIHSEPHWHTGNLVTSCGNTSRVTLVCEIETRGNLLHNAAVNHDSTLWSSRWFRRSKNKFIWTPATEANSSRALNRLLQLWRRMSDNGLCPGCQPFELCMSPSPQCSSITPGAMTEWRTEGGHSPHRYSPADKCQRSSLEDHAFRALNLPQRK